MKYFYMLIFTLISSYGIGEITQISSFREADISQLTSNSLVIFDVDEVLIVSADAVLSPAGYDYTSPLWPHVLRNRELLSIALNSTEYVIIDPETLQFFEELNQRNISVIALTACGTGSIGQIPSLVDWRIQKLEKLGIKFDFFYKNHHIFHQLVKFRQNAPVYKNGILFCGDFARQEHSKGRLLENFFDLIQWEPDHVIFFDDLMHNHKALEKTLSARNIPFHGYHFTADFNHVIVPEVVDLQMETLFNRRIWLSDEQAKEHLQQIRNVE